MVTLVIVLRGVTILPERKLSGMKLNQFDAQGLYKLAIEQGADAVIFADIEGIIQIWNASAQAMFGFPSTEALGKSLNIIIPEDLRAAHWDAFGAAIKAGRTKHDRSALTTRSMTKDGKKIYVSLSFSIIRNDQGEVLGALATGREVTAQYLAEKNEDRVNSST